LKLKPDYVQTYSWGHESLKAYVNERYVTAGGMMLLKGSPHIHWDRLNK